MSLLDTVRFPIAAPPQAIPNGVVTNILWSHLVDWDSSITIFPSQVVDTTHLLVGVGAIYRVGVMIEWAVSGAGSRLVRPLASSGADLRIAEWTPPNPAQPTQQLFSGEVAISGNDFITVGVFQDSGGPLNVIDGWVTLDRIN